MVHQENHRGLSLPPGGENLIQLIKTAAAIHDIANHLEVPECHFDLI
jgi:hypothetical protein